MRSLIKIFNIKFLLGGSFIVLLFACTKTKNYEDVNLPRMFTPVGLRLTVGLTEAKLEWDPSLFTSGKEVQYTVEVNKDSTFQAAPDFSKVLDTTVIVVTDSDIPIRTRFFMRLKANASGSTAESNWISTAGFSLTGEQIFVVPVPESDIIDNAVILRWTTTPGVTKLVLTPNGGTAFDVTLSAADNTAGFKLVTGLQPNTVYAAEIFAGTKSKGLLSFRTKTAITGTNIIDLRGITGRPLVLQDTIPVVPSGSIIILQRGLTYNITSTASLDKSLSIVSGADFVPELATIYFQNNFNLVAGSSIDSVVFRDLTMMSEDYNSRYIFNISQVGTIGKVVFDNVRGHRFRGFFRMQTGGAGTQVANVIINNCVIDSLRDFSLVNSNNSNTAANILVTNTTVYNARKVIDHRSPGNNSIKFQNCTFFNLPSGGPADGTGGQYFIDMDAQNSATPIVIQNCIFGKTWDDVGQGTNARGIRVGASTTVSVINTYQTADCIINTMYPIGGLTYTGTSYTLFTDPDNGNFKLKDSNFAGFGNSGDPRWY